MTAAAASAILLRRRRWRCVLRLRCRCWLLAAPHEHSRGERVSDNAKQQRSARRAAQWRHHKDQHNNKLNKQGKPTDGPTPSDTSTNRLHLGRAVDRSHDVAIDGAKRSRSGVTDTRGASTFHRWCHSTDGGSSCINSVGGSARSRTVRHTMAFDDRRTRRSKGVACGADGARQEASGVGTAAAGAAAAVPRAFIRALADLSGMRL